MASEEDLYVAQLHELFRSCDSCGDGLLSKNELVILCEQLELSPLQSYYMTDRLIGSDHLIKVRVSCIVSKIQKLHPPITLSP
jgi:hypothetical protein